MGTISPEQMRAQTLLDWQAQWSSSLVASWTRRLIPRISPWFGRRHGRIDRYLAQAFSGHGPFGTYLFKRGLRASDSCRFCGAVDSPEHAIFWCLKWDNERGVFEGLTGSAMLPETLITTMISSADHWNVGVWYVGVVMSAREELERALRVGGLHGD